MNNKIIIKKKKEALAETSISRLNLEKLCVWKDTKRQCACWSVDRTSEARGFSSLSNVDLLPQSYPAKEAKSSGPGPFGKARSTE
jgi:hypothetical protein